MRRAFGSPHDSAAVRVGWNALLPRAISTRETRVAAPNAPLFAVQGVRGLLDSFLPSTCRRIGSAFNFTKVETPRDASVAFLESRIQDISRATREREFRYICSKCTQSRTLSATSTSSATEGLRKARTSIYEAIRVSSAIRGN